MPTTFRLLWRQDVSTAQFQTKTGTCQWILSWGNNLKFHGNEQANRQTWRTQLVHFLQLYLRTRQKCSVTQITDTQWINYKTEGHCGLLYFVRRYGTLSKFSHLHFHTNVRASEFCRNIYWRGYRLCVGSIYFTNNSTIYSTIFFNKSPLIFINL